jgi:hypothetical protein
MILIELIEKSADTEPRSWTGVSSQPESFRDRDSQTRFLPLPTRVSLKCLDQFRCSRSS